MHSISIEGMEFYAYHGVMAEENVIGNRFTVDLTVWTDFSQAAQQDDLNGTVNYFDLYQITAQVMKNEAKLLEYIAYQVIQEIFERFAQITEAQVSIYKHNPPVGGLVKWSKVSLQEKRK